MVGWRGGALLQVMVFGLVAAGAQAPITLSVDLRDAPKKILHATETIPVQPGAMTLVYPKWIPGEHGPTGPIDNQAGFFITGRGANGESGQKIEWQRDPVEMYSYHITVPAGVTQLEVKMDFLATPNGGNFTAGGSTSANLAVLSWNSLVVYPYSGPTMKASDVMVTPSITLPDGWRYGTALELTGAAPGDHIGFKTVSLEQLVDSPVLTGRFFREVELAPDVTPKHYLDMAADGPEDLALSQQHIAEFSKLVRETGALYKSRHYGSYHFLVTLSDQVAHFGLEHHQSSDDRVGPTDFISDTKFTLGGLLLPHEFTHSWNGKYRRPAGLATPNYQVPMVGDLLWVYEGLTEYLGDVLAARCGIWTPELYRDRLATIAARYSNRPGRTWRNIEDTARMAQVLYNVGGPYDNWRLDTDFYDEGELIWLDVDTTIRKMTNGKKSINDFTAAFHGLGGNTAPKVVPYTFDDVVAALNGVVANDWAGFLRERIESHSPTPPLGGITNGGYTLVYQDSPNTWTAMEEAESGTISFWYSLGLSVGQQGVIGDVLVGGISDKAGFGPGMKIIAVNGREFAPDVLRAAVREAKGTQAPIEFIVENTGFFKVLKVDYHEGEKYPAFQRVASTPDRMDEILTPMVK
jgi:predicted metalloprotease with PDZ domain